MQYEYKINDDERIIYQFYKGTFRIEDLESAILKLTKDSSFNPDYNILTDLRKCKFEFRPGELENFLKIFKKTLGSNSGRGAIIIDSPIETAISQIFQDLVKKIRSVEIFSTSEAAIVWLQSSL